MLTTTQDEFNKIRYEAQEAYRQSVTDFVKSSLIGGDPGIDKMEELALYIDVLGSWEQDEYSYLSHTNYLTDFDVRSIYNRVRSLQR